MDHGHLKYVRPWSEHDRGALGVSEFQLAAIAKELVEVVLTPEERKKYRDNRASRRSGISTVHEGMFHCRGCGDQVAFSMGCERCGLCIDCCPHERRRTT